MEVQDISVIQKKPMPLGTYWKLLWIFSWDRSNLELNGSQLMKQAHVHQDTDIMSQQQADSGYPMFPLKFGVHWFSEFSSGKSQFGFYTSWILQYGFLFYVYTPKSSVVRKVTGKCAWVISQCNFHFFFFVVVVQSLSCVWLSAAPWAAAWQASLSFTISWSLLKLMTIELGVLFNHLIKVTST